jgi:glucose-1-phosphate thymidylyltransferase
MTRAVVLARGLGSRMRQDDGSARLSPQQAAAAAAGHKAMMPINGRPFLDYLLSALADAALTDVALVVAPDHERLRRHYVADAPPSRLRMAFIVQPEALGTADAIAATRSWVGDEPFLAMNSDNLYPVAALRDLAALDEPGLPAFDVEDLIASSNIPPDRVRSFATIDVDEHGYLTGIVEKPNDVVRASDVELPPEGGSYGVSSGSHETDPAASAFRRKHQLIRRKSALISMNCWRFDARIFEACRDVPRSARGELELPEAVGLAVRRGVRFRAVPARGPVLDLSRRADAADVERRLAGTVPSP